VPVKIGDTYPYTFESGEQIAYRVCTAEDLREFLEQARAEGALVCSFDDPLRRVVGWCVGDQGRAMTIMEIRDKWSQGVLDAWWWERLRTPAGRGEIAARYSVRGE